MGSISADNLTSPSMTKRFLKIKVLQITPWAVLVLGLFITASAWHAARYEKELLARAAFEREVQNAQGRLVKRIRSYETLLGLAKTALHAPGRRASEMPDGSLLTDLLQTEYPAVAALGWITGQDEAVGADDVRYRFRGIPSVAGCSRQTFDLTATSQVADTLSRAGESGRVASSEKLVIDCGTGPLDFLLFVQAVDTGGDREGWISSLVRPAPLLTAPWNPDEVPLTFSVFDNSRESPDALLYWAGGSEPEESAWFQRSVSVTVGGRIWSFRFSTRETFDQVFEKKTASALPWRGLALSVLAFAMTWTLGFTRRESILARRNPLTETGQVARAVVKNALEALITLDMKGTIRFVNPAAERMFGYKTTEAFGMNASRILEYQEDRKTKLVRLLWAGNWDEEIELTGLRKDGTRFPVQIHGSKVSTADRTVFTLSVRDITKEKRADERLQQLASLPDDNPLPIVETDLQGKVTYINPEASSRFPDLREGTSLHPLLAKLPDAIKQLAEEGIPRAVEEVQVGDLNYELHVCYVPSKRFVRLFAFDVSDRHEAMHDALTGLANRKMFLGRLSDAARASQSVSDAMFAVLFLDLDHFKMLNDSLGHMMGDRLLTAVGRRLETCVRPADLVARLGGDEFTILLEDVDDVRAVTRVASRIQAQLTMPFQLGSHHVTTSCSIGVVTSASGFDEAADLLSFADAAMYRAKTTGRARYVVFDPLLDREALSKSRSVFPA